jgi:hypothetical protein
MRLTLPAVTLAIAIAADGAAYSAPAPVGACALLTKNEIKPFIKIPSFDQTPAEQVTIGSGSTCNYAGGAIQIDAYPFSVFESTWSKDKGNLERISGLGDEALFYRNSRAFSAEIAVRVGRRVLTAQVDLDQNESMDAAKTRAIGLARAAVAKLR